MFLPDDVVFIINRLNNAGFSAYAVGGCVRDSLLGTAPKDYDITTSAKPDEMKAVFADRHIVETGLKHGTITVVLNHVPYEITTYRIDGEYTDHRHPDSVHFVDNLHLDLSRRDFTINAMAYHPLTGLVDDYGGERDLQQGIIRCVGNSTMRFEEDALRILRALRFASRFDFAIDPATSEGVHNLKSTLSQVAPERIRVELAKLITGKGAEHILRQYSDVIFAIFPQLKAMEGFQQNNPHHKYDVWDHTIRSVSFAPAVESLRLAMLLHDSGKPFCYTEEKSTNPVTGEMQLTGHFYAHAKKSAEIAGKVLSFLKVDNALFDKVHTLVLNHDCPITAEKTILRRRIRTFGAEMLKSLLDVQFADKMATGTSDYALCRQEYDEITAALDKQLSENPCFSLKNMAINGKDLLKLGFHPGAGIGKCLNTMLDRIVEGELDNNINALNNFAYEYGLKHGLIDNDTHWEE